MYLEEEHERMHDRNIMSYKNGTQIFLYSVAQKEGEYMLLKNRKCI